MRESYLLLSFIVGFILFLVVGSITETKESTDTIVTGAATAPQAGESRQFLQSIAFMLMTASLALISASVISIFSKQN